MFPLGLAAFINRYWANTSGRGVLVGRIGVYLARLVLFQIAKVVVDIASVRRSFDSACVQCLRLPCHAEYPLTSDRSL